MKKTYFILSFAAAAMVFTQSCRKSDLLERNDAPVVTNQTVNASVAENTSYTYTLSAAGPAQVTTSAAHAKASIISTDANGISVYQYTPVANYVGTDVVVISTVSGAAQQNSGCFGPGGGNPHHGGNGGHQGKDGHTTITTITLTVTASSTVVTNTVYTRPTIN